MKDAELQFKFWFYEMTELQFNLDLRKQISRMIER